MTILSMIHILILMVEIIFELTDLVVMQYKHTIFRIFHKNFDNWSFSCQNFNKI